MFLSLLSISFCYAENPYSVPDNTPAETIITASGSVKFVPLEIWPPEGHDFSSIVLGDIIPGQSKDINDPDYWSNKAEFLINGAIGYNVSITVPFIISQNGLSIRIAWYVGDDPRHRTMLEICQNYASNSYPESYSFDYPIPNVAGISLLCEIKKMKAEPGAPVGERIFNVTVECAYKESL